MNNASLFLSAYLSLSLSLSFKEVKKKKDEKEKETKYKTCFYSFDNSKICFWFEFYVFWKLCTQFFKSFMTFKNSAYLSTFVIILYTYRCSVHNKKTAALCHP